MVSFWLWYGVGARNEHAGITGISHWVEHMMFKGTQNLGKGQIMQMVAENGGTLNAFHVGRLDHLFRDPALGPPGPALCRSSRTA